MDKTQLDRLTRVLGLLSSDQAGERAAAALKASRMIEQAGTSWDELLQRPEPASRRREYGIDYTEAAEARMRQLKASNKALEAEVTRLRSRVNRMADEARRAYYDDSEEEMAPL